MMARRISQTWGLPSRRRLGGLTRYAPGLLGGAAVCLLSAGARADVLIPPGYQGVVQVTDDEAFNRRPAMNNHGQFVFSKRSNPNDTKTSEIYLYDNGKLTRLTNDYLYDDFPEINDGADIVWSRAVGTAATLEIVLYRDGKLTRLTEDAVDDYSPVINNGGCIAWDKWIGGGCEDSNTVVCLYDGTSTQTITDGLHCDQYVRLNDLGDIVWTRFDFCQDPWMSQILLRTDGIVLPLTGKDGAPRAPDINNNRLVAYLSQEAPDWQHHIHLWKDGITTILTDWGSAGRLNDRADLVFNRWHDDSSTWQVWLYRDGKFWQITNDPFWNFDGDIDQAGNIAWDAGEPFDVDIKLLKRLPLADLNCDGIVNAFDIDPFVTALTSPAQYEALYPDCDRALADINTDGQVDAFDIDPFVEVLTR